MEKDTSSSKKDKQKEQVVTALFFKFPPFWTNGPWCHEFFMMILLTRGGPNPQVHSLNGTKAEKCSWIKVRGLSDKPWRAWLPLLNQSKPQSQSNLQLSLCGLKTLFHRRKKIMQVWEWLQNFHFWMNNPLNKTKESCYYSWFNSFSNSIMTMSHLTHTSIMVALI